MRVIGAEHVVQRGALGAGDESGGERGLPGELPGALVEAPPRPLAVPVRDVQAGDEGAVVVLAAGAIAAAVELRAGGEDRPPRPVERAPHLVPGEAVAA